MCDVKLFYFDFWGRGELSRLLLAASGQPWEDVRFSREEWHQTDRYKPRSPFGSVPFLEYKGKTYGQSIAIASFLAREFGFVGKSNLDALRNDEVVQLVQEMMDLLVKIYYEQDAATKAELVEKMKKEQVPKYYTIFQRLLEENGGSGHFVGKELSMADLAVYDLVTNVQAWFSVPFDDNYPGVRTLRKEVDANANVRKYLESQKQNIL